MSKNLLVLVQLKMDVIPSEFTLKYQPKTQSIRATKE